MRKVTTFFILSFFSLGLACYILVPPKSQSVPNNTNVTVECLACGCNNIDMVTKKGNKKPSEISNKHCILSQGDRNLTCWIVVVETTSIRCIGGARAHTSTWSTISVETGNLSTNIKSILGTSTMRTPECTNTFTNLDNSTNRPNSTGWLAAFLVSLLVNVILVVLVLIWSIFKTKSMFSSAWNYCFNSRN